MVTIASRLRCNVSIVFKGRRASARGIVAVMLLSASVGTVARLEVDGPEEAVAMRAIAALFRDGLANGRNVCGGCRVSRLGMNRRIAESESASESQVRFATSRAPSAASAERWALGLLSHSCALTSSAFPRICGETESFRAFRRLTDETAFPDYVPQGDSPCCNHFIARRRRFWPWVL